MKRMRYFSEAGAFNGVISEVPVFPVDSFTVAFPEGVGDTANPKWCHVIKAEWTEKEDGKWRSDQTLEGELVYTIDIEPHEDYIDFWQTLTNKSEKKWEQSFAFDCFNFAGSVEMTDHECTRTWVRTGGEFKRLTEIPRTFGDRPTINLYSVEGAPAGMDIPFVANYKSTPLDVAIEGWMAVVSADGKRLLATVSKQCLFTFQNIEYSCIHTGPGFGALEPGQTGKALTRLYFVEASLEDWYARMVKEMAKSE